MGGRVIKASRRVEILYKLLIVEASWGFASLASGDIDLVCVGLRSSFIQRVTFYFIFLFFETFVLCLFVFLVFILPFFATFIAKEGVIIRKKKKVKNHWSRFYSSPTKNTRLKYCVMLKVKQ